MKDIFNIEIKENDIIAYCGRAGNKLVLRYGVVLKERANWHIKTPRVKVRAIDEKYLNAARYKLKEVNFISSSQIWVIKDESMLPKKLIETLHNAYEKDNYLEMSPVEQEQTKTLSAPERYKINAEKLMRENIINDIRYV